MAERKTGEATPEMLVEMGNTPTTVILRLDCPWTPAQAAAAREQGRKVWVGFGEQQLEMTVVAWEGDEDGASSVITVMADMMVGFGEPPAVD